MRKTLLVASIACACVGVLCASQLLAQRTATTPPAPRGGTVLVNMGELMKNSARFNQAMERLKQEYENKARALQKEGERGNQLTEELRKLPPNSAERKQREDEILKLRADYELHGKKVTEDIRDQESKIVLGFLAELKQELDRYGQASGTRLILRNDPAPAELTDPRMILQEIHKPIVYQRGLDATPSLLDSLNRSAGTRAPAGGVPTTGRAPVAPTRPAPR